MHGPLAHRAQVALVEQALQQLVAVLAGGGLVKGVHHRVMSFKYYVSHIKNSALSLYIA